MPSGPWKNFPIKYHFPPAPAVINNDRFRNSLSILNSSTFYHLMWNIRAGAHENFDEKFRLENFERRLLLFKSVFYLNFWVIRKRRSPSKDLISMILKTNSFRELALTTGGGDYSWSWQNYFYAMDNYFLEHFGNFSAWFAFVKSMGLYKTCLDVYYFPFWTFFNKSKFDIEMAYWGSGPEFK